MNCCLRCFADIEVRGEIETNSTQSGKCDYCKSEGISLVPAVELLNLFQDLILSYMVSPKENPNAKRLYLQLKSWNIFADYLPDPAIEALVYDIGSDLLADNKDLFEQLTLPKVLADEDGIQLADEYNITWNNFKEEIKSTNRFFIQNTFEFEKVKDILTSYRHSYKKEKRFYRARNSDKGGINISYMGRPPALHATPGRANPKGISYLYLANDIKTTLYEVRAAIYDYVTVAEFKLIEEINIVSLRHSSRISPLQLDDLNKFLLYEQFVQSLHEDLKKPLRRQDSELEYLPTQYLCELIKYLGYDGVEYSSSMNPAGFNIALFDDKKVKCISSTLYEINSIKYNYTEIAPE